MMESPYSTKLKQRSLRRVIFLPLIFMIIIVAVVIYGPFRSNIDQVQAATETKWASSHIAGTFSNPTNANGATNATWSGDLNTNSNYTSRWAMEDPSGSITGTQTISALSRKGTNSGIPTIAINLYENGVLVQSVAAATNVTSTTGQTVSGTFSAAAITNPANVEIEIVEVGAGGSGSVRNSAQIDSIEWTVNLADPSITVGTSGSHVSNLAIPSTDAYVGGAFTFVRNSGTASVTSIKIRDTGTVNAQSNLSNIKLFYKTEATCSSSIPGDATQFNATPGTFDASSDTTVTGTMAVGTSQVCVYVSLDVGSGAASGETIVLQITNPSTDIVASAGTVTPSSAVAISGSVTLGSSGPTTDEVMRHGNRFSGGTEQGFFWAD